MTEPALATISYEEQDRQVSWRGVSMEAGDGFNMFLTNDVAARLHDEEGKTEFEAHLRGLVNTGFASDSLNAILAAEIPELRDWAGWRSIGRSLLGS